MRHSRFTGAAIAGFFFLAGCATLSANGEAAPSAGSQTFYGYATTGTVQQSSAANWAKFALSPPELTVENNDWGIPANGQGGSTVFTETIDSSTAFGWAYNVTNGTNVAMYPEVGYGWSPNANASWGGNPTIPSLGQHASITSDFVVLSRHGSASDTWDLAYDIWIAPTPHPATVKGGFELMIWLDHNKQGPWANGAPPRNVTIDGVPYNAYTNKGHDAGWTVLTYINAGAGISSRTGFSLSDVIADAAAAYGIPDSDYVAAIEFGNEVVNGSGITEIPTWAIHVGSGS